MFEYCIPDLLPLIDLLQFVKVNKKTSKLCKKNIFQLYYQQYKYKCPTKCNIPYDFIQYYLLQRPESAYFICSNAASFGNISLIKNLCIDYQLLTNCLQKTMYNACLNGHLNVLQFLYEEYKVPLQTNCWAAIGNDYVCILEYLHLKNYEFDQSCIFLAIRNNSQRAILWLCNNRLYDLHYLHFNYAVAQGNKSIVELLHSFGLKGSNPIAHAHNYCQDEDFIYWLQLLLK